MRCIGDHVLDIRDATQKIFGGDAILGINIVVD